MSRIAALAPEVDHFRRRVLQDALSEALSVQWERRAAEFEAAAPRQSDFPGRAPSESREQRTQRILEAARACRARALVAVQCPEAFDRLVAEGLW